MPAKSRQSCAKGAVYTAEDLKVDTHGSAVKDDVWDLLAYAYRKHGLRPTLLERDFNFPPFEELLGEVARIRDVQARVA